MSEILLDPQDLRIMKGLLTEPKFAQEFSAGYGDWLFTNGSRKVAGAILDHLKQYRTPPTYRILQELVPDGAPVLQAIQQTNLEPGELAWDLDKAKGRYRKTETLKLRTALDGAPEDIQKEIRRYQEGLARLEPSYQKTFTRQTVAEYADTFLENYVAKMNNSELAKGIMTGYTDLDFVTNGFIPGDLILIGGETNAGKSQFLSNIAVQMWIQGNQIEDTVFTKGYNVLFLSLEMPFEICFRRFLAKVADVPNYSIRDAVLNKSEAESVKKALDFLKRYPARFDIVDVPRGLTLSALEGIIKDSLSSYQPDIIIIDYLGLMESLDVEGDDWLKLGHIAAGLHELMRVYKAVGVTAAQLNRIAPTAKKKEEIVGNHRFGRSSHMAHHCTHCLILETGPDSDKLSTLPIHLTKNREGEKITFSVTKKLENSSLVNIPNSANINNEYESFELTEHQKKDITKLLTNKIKI